LKLQRALKAREYHALKTEKRKAAKQTRKQFVDELDRLTAGQVHLSATQVALIAESLRYMYPKEIMFSPALKAYLKSKAYSKEDIAMVLGARSRDRENSDKRRATAERTAGRASPNSSLSLSAAMSIATKKQESTTLSKGKKRTGESSKQPPPKRVRIPITERARLFNREHTTLNALNAAIMPNQDATRKDPSSPPRHGDIDQLESGNWWEGGFFN
jgi:hypothetical protein